MDKIANNVKAGRSIVLKSEVFACSEEKISTDDISLFT